MTDVYKASTADILVKERRKKKAPAVSKHTPCWEKIPLAPGLATGSGDAALSKGLTLSLNEELSEALPTPPGAYLHQEETSES